MPYQKTKEGRLVNEITLGDGYPLSNDKQPLKVGGEASIINVSSPTPDGSVDGEVEIKGKLKAKDTVIQGDLKVFSDSDVTPQFQFETKQGQACLFTVNSAANTLTRLQIKNNQGSWFLKRNVSSTTLEFNDGTNTPLILDGNNVEFTNLTDGSITIDSFVDEDNMSSNSATKIPTQQSVKAYVDNEVAGLVDSAPAALDTLNELAAALNDDASFSTTITNSLATKVGLTGDETIAGVKTFSSAVTIHTATDAQLNFKTSDDSWAYMQFLQNDGTRRAFIGMDNDLDTLRINATENGANEIQIDTTTVDINASVDISGDVTVDTDTLKVDSSNNRVGIGTTSPQSLLHLQGSGNTGGLYFKNSYDIVRQYFQNDSDNSPFVITYDGTGGAEIKLQSDGDLILNGTNGDNVGIGTESPVSLLHVDEGDIRIDTASGGNQALRFSEANNTRAQIQYKSGDEQLNFITDNASGSDTTRMTIKSEQDATAVGIGTDSPTTTLDVEGTVSYKHISLTDSSDDLDVSGCTVVECTPSGTDTLGGLTGGVQGQILHILKVDSGLGRIIIEHNEGTGNQDIFLSGGSDVMLSSRGGITLYCNGTSWFALDK